MTNKGIYDKPPLLYIQNDWEKGVREGNGSIWVAWKEKGKPSKEEQITHSLTTSGVPLFSETLNLTVQYISDTCLKVHLRNSPYSTIFLAPSKEWSEIHQKSITSLDVTSTGVAVSTCCADKLKIWNLEDGYVKVELNGHEGQIYKCRFLPSELVVVSCGADLKVKIWDANSGVCPVTFSGHQLGVTDVAVVGRGRNLITTSRDGTALLWHTATSQVLGVLARPGSPINCCCLYEDPALASQFQPDAPPSEQEIGTDNSILVVGSEDGMILVVAVKARKVVRSVQLESAVNALAVMKDTQGVWAVVAGLQDGTLKCLIPSQTDLSPLEIYTSSSSAVLSILALPRSNFLFATADGSVHLCSLNPAHTDALVLTGPNCDPVYDLATDGRAVYTCCRDHIIRKYVIEPSYLN